jgi:hypothetical protein
MTIAQERKFYREAVRACLQEFYGIPENRSKTLTGSWWKRLSATQAFASGIFMHSEPMNTAAGIAGLQVIPLTSNNRQKYHRLLDRSRAAVLSPAKPSSRREAVRPAPRIETETAESSGPKLLRPQIVREMSKHTNSSIEESEHLYNSLATSAVQRVQPRSAEFYVAGIGQVVRARRLTGRRQTSEE